jgi:hypothetical protein
MLLQDRVEEALASFARIDRRSAARVQVRLPARYLDFFSDDHAQRRARSPNSTAVSGRALAHDVRRRARPTDEAGGSPPSGRGRSRPRAAPGRARRKEPTLAIDLDGRRVKLAYHNVASCEVSYYPMDIEFLFPDQSVRAAGLARLRLHPPAARTRSRCQRINSSTRSICPPNCRR